LSELSAFGFIRVGKLKTASRKSDAWNKKEQEQEEGASGLEGFNAKRQKRIEGRKKRIVGAIEEKGSVQTGEVSDMLDVSRTTAYRYLEELEKDGKLKQVKKFGRSVSYRLPE